MKKMVALVLLNGLVAVGCSPTTTPIKKVPSTTTPAGKNVGTEHETTTPPGKTETPPTKSETPPAPKPKDNDKHK
jgi:hypothetical protein